ncbi:MAG: hypothetical protein E6R12_12300 [Sphingomonadales bacterium]|nr:MAG: hypothetical protein E6R12_12300 [Sphingomonadales bacterium]
MVDAVTRTFDFYSILYWGGRPPLADRTAAAQIHCYDGDTMVGMIQFFSGADAVPANQLAGDMVVINYEIARFNDVVSLLRTEGPLMLTVDPGSGAGYIGTFLEPVGVEEDDEDDFDDYGFEEDDSDEDDGDEDDGDEDDGDDDAEPEAERTN